MSQITIYLNKRLNKISKPSILHYFDTSKEIIWGKLENPLKELRTPKMHKKPTEPNQNQQNTHLRNIKHFPLPQKITKTLKR